MPGQCALHPSGNSSRVVNVHESSDIEVIVGLDQPAALKRGWLHLMAVRPPRLTTDEIAQRRYLFTFALTEAADPAGCPRYLQMMCSRKRLAHSMLAAQAPV